MDEEAGLLALSAGLARGRKRRQTVPIADDLKPCLAEARLVATSDHVIGWHGRRIASVKKGFSVAISAAKLDGVTPHILRHTAATWMIQGGVPIKMVADYLGDTVEMIQNVYGPPLPGLVAARFQCP